MNDFEVVDIKDEHFKQIVKMIAKFGVPTGADHFENVEKLKKYVEEDEKRGKVALESRSGELVGFIFYCLGFVWPLEAFKREFHRSSEIGYISDIIVHPGFQRRGIGSRLVKAAEADLTAMGVRRVTLITSNANHGAQVFFKKLGYSVSGQTDVVGFEKFL